MSLTYSQVQTVVTPTIISTGLAARVNTSIGFYLAAVMVESAATANHDGRVIYARNALVLPAGLSLPSIRRSVYDVMKALGYDDLTVDATVQTAVNTAMDILITQ